MKIQAIRHKKRNLIISLVCLLIFIVVGTMVHLNSAILISADNFFSTSFQNSFGYPMMNYKGNLLNDLMTFLATFGNPFYLIVLTIIISTLLFAIDRKFFALWFIGVVSTGGIVSVIMKLIFHRGRPLGHLPNDSGFSFPSGHSTESTLVFLIILIVLIPLLKKKSIKYIAFISVVIIWVGILFSRLYFNAHHFSDIVGGISFGAFWVFSAMAVYDIILNWFKKTKSDNSVC
ncbi:phosphatase PAP2 family protein [Liquorilactobacillus uvarum]|uniref:phosphatase PAP2 family protein n=1 Tax=Liquorilactobacillus uvarum TaxID=303240 RepID=UPI00288C01DD|nr:phosphatase PAP2 family protein [Liquorilactobacillus uvarum]